ncbi:MAG TPA: AmmeMemoRadiSam system protein A [Gammaproteobacteria bacterium]|nr:AmmeMemoRadiSam system protein A [Gammaproteobacteria bacterium]
MPFTDISDEEKAVLLDIARQSISHGLQYSHALPIQTENYSPLLQLQGASFVTLYINQQLRGCIGTLEAYQPLVNDVSEHAYAAAFKDPRFAAVNASELPLLEIHISILTPARPMQFSSEADLIRQLKPGIDGLILEDEHHRGTFLPSVWEALPEARDFLSHLKMKAGMNRNDWHPGIRVSRYKTVLIEPDKSS